MEQMAVNARMMSVHSLNVMEDEESAHYNSLKITCYFCQLGGNSYHSFSTTPILQW